jgi:hypothetical protein
MLPSNKNQFETYEESVTQFVRTIQLPAGNLCYPQAGGLIIIASALFILNEPLPYSIFSWYSSVSL